LLQGKASQKFPRHLPSFAILSLSKTLAQKGFAMSHTIKYAISPLPDSNFGKPLVDFIAVLHDPDEHEAKGEHRFVVSLGKDDEKNEGRLYILHTFYDKADGFKQYRSFLNGNLVVALDAGSAFKREKRGEKIVNEIWYHLEKWYEEHRQEYKFLCCRLAKPSEKDSVEADVVRYFLPENKLPGLVLSNVLIPTPTDMQGNPYYDYPSPVPPAAPRLSKEDWLKANYPEMSELPKWRFPAVAAG
jgi:hypothetical protein